jgi:hypothetical protein
VSVPRLEFEIPFPPSPFDECRRLPKYKLEQRFKAEVRERFRAAGPITFKPTSVSLVVSHPSQNRPRVNLIAAQASVVGALSSCNAIHLVYQLDHVEVVRGDAERPGVVVILEGAQ